MSLWVAIKRNAYVKPGTYLELFEDGFQKAMVKQVGNRLEVTGNAGLILPERELKPFVMRVLNRGLDKPDLRRH